MSSNRSSAAFIFLALFALSPLAAQSADAPATVADPGTADTPAAAEPGAAPAAKPKGPTTVTIKNARRMDFTKDPISGGDAIMLTGAAEISVESDGKTTIIFAEKIYVNRDKDMLYAEGSVILNRQGGVNEENLTANSLLINTETFEGIFDGARIVSLGGTPAPPSPSTSDSEKNTDATLAAAAATAAALGGASKSTLIVNSELFGRDTKGTMVFKNGTLTFCDDEENPHWKITASRIYLLPGQEFALANMVLWVGSVPVLWLPGFYYPKDELIFNPAFGMEDRRGFFVQTTTYIIGRKPLPEDGSESSFNFLKNTSLKKQVREGLILHNLDENDDSTNKNYLKIMGDYYSNLGFLAGVEGILIPPKYVTELDFSFLLGFSRTIFGSSAPYSVHNPNDSKEYWDKTNIFGQEIPFRYKGNVNVTVSNPFSLSVKMPFYSDTEFDTDFKKREETMDWLSYITTNKLADEEEEDDTVAVPVPSYNWKVDASYNVPVDLFNPFVNSLSLNYSFDLLFASAINDTITDSQLKQYNPLHNFFYPSQMVPVDAKVSLAGTLIDVPFTKRIKSAKKTAIADAKPAGLIPPEDITPAEKADSTADTPSKIDDVPSASTDDMAEKGLLPQTALPSMTAGLASAALPGGVAYSLGYTFTPEVKVTNTYPVPQRLKPGGNPAVLSDWWNDPAESSMDALKSLGYTIKPTTALNSGISWRNGFIGMTNKIGLSPVIENHTLTEREDDKPPPYGFTLAERNVIRKTDFTNTKLDITAANAVSFKPFIYNGMFSDTGIIWNTDIKILRNKFRGEKVDELERDYVWTGWDEESFTLHTLSAIFAFAEAPFTSSLTLTANLPPRLDAYSAAFATAFAPWVTVGASAGIHKLATDSTNDKNGDGWLFDPFKETLTVKLFKDKLNLTQSYAYDIEEKEHTELRFGLSGYGASFTFAMQRTQGFDWDNKTGSPTKDTWVSRKDPNDTTKNLQEFLPVSLALSYTNPGIEIFAWKNRMKLSVGGSTSLNYDMIRPPLSEFSFSPKLIFSVNQFLHIGFSVQSRNKRIFWYFQDLDNHNINNGNPPPGVEKNFFIDLFNSFAFWDPELQRKSGFKLESLTLDVVHELHDWFLAASLTLAPQATGTMFKTEFSVSVLWRPMQSIKATVKTTKEGGEDAIFRLNPGETSKPTN